MTYGKDFAKIEARVKEIETKLGHFPRYTELVQLGEQSLYKAMSRHHPEYLKARMSEPPEDGMKPRGYWQNRDNVVKEYELIKLKHGLETLPSTDWLQSNGYSSFALAISSYMGGFAAFRESVGEQVMKRDVGSFQNLDTLVSEVRKILAENKLSSLPSHYTLLDLGLGYIIHPINDHGGFRYMRTLLGEKQRKADPKQLQDKQYVINLANQLKAKHGWESLPKGHTLIKLGYSELYTAINHYGGMRAFRTLLGEKQREREKGFWKSEQNCIQFAQEIKQKHGWSELPTQSVLVKNGYSSFVAGLNKYHNGLIVLAQKLGERKDAIKPGQWQDYEFFKQQVCEFMREHNLQQIPTLKYFKDNGRYDITNAVNYHGGINSLREKLGQQRSRLESDSLKDRTFVKEKVEEILIKEGWKTLPGAETLQNAGYSWLSNAIARHHKGMTQFRKSVLKDESDRNEIGYYKNWENVKADLLQLIEKLGTFPKQEQLRQLKMSSLTAQILKHHGGLPAAKQRLIQEGLFKSEDSLDMLLQEYVA